MNGEGIGDATPLRSNRPQMESARVDPLTDPKASEWAVPGIEPLAADLRRAVDRCCTGWLEQYRDDIFQVGFMRLMKAMERGGPLNKTYIKRVAYTAMVDEIRRLRPQRMATEMVDPPARGGESDPEQVFSGRRVGTAIRRCLDHLRVARRRALVLYLQGHSVPEAARLLGWSVKKAENLVYRGRTEIRDCLERQGVRP